METTLSKPELFARIRVRRLEANPLAFVAWVSEHLDQFGTRSAPSRKLAILRMQGIIEQTLGLGATPGLSSGGCKHPSLVTTNDPQRYRCIDCGSLLPRAI